LEKGPAALHHPLAVTIFIAVSTGWLYLKGIAIVQYGAKPHQSNKSNKFNKSNSERPHCQVTMSFQISEPRQARQGTKMRKKTLKS
jgi:hypothetical protein